MKSNLYKRLLFTLLAILTLLPQGFVYAGQTETTATSTPVSNLDSQQQIILEPQALYSLQEGDLTASGTPVSNNLLKADFPTTVFNNVTPIDSFAGPYGYHISLLAFTLPTVEGTIKSVTLNLYDSWNGEVPSSVTNVYKVTAEYNPETVTYNNYTLDTSNLVAQFVNEVTPNTKNIELTGSYQSGETIYLALRASIIDGSYQGAQIHGLTGDYPWSVNVVYTSDSSTATSTTVSIDGAVSLYFYGIVIFIAMYLVGKNI